MPVSTVEYHIQHYDLEQGALEIQYIEEFFGEFPRKKTASEIVRRLHARAHLICSPPRRSLTIPARLCPSLSRWHMKSKRPSRSPSSWI